MEPATISIECTRPLTDSPQTCVNRAGAGLKPAGLFLHGSRPGVSAWAKWQVALASLGRGFDRRASDLVSFGQSEHPDSPLQAMSAWFQAGLTELTALLDTLALERIHLASNSMGGAIALLLMWRHPERGRSAALIGTLEAPFEFTLGRDGDRGFREEPTLERLVQMLRRFVYEPLPVGVDLEAIARLRDTAAQGPATPRSSTAMFPPPHQRHHDHLVVPADVHASIEQQLLLIYERDDQIIPLVTSLHLLRWLPHVQLYGFGQCSHWTQIEARDACHQIVESVIAGEI